MTVRSVSRRLPVSDAPFGTRLVEVFGSTGRLCVGIDPHASLLAEWGLPDSGAGLREFGLRVVEAAHGRAGIVKPQVGFFERHGAAGYAALEEVVHVARRTGLIVIADVKRGDIGSSVDAYAEAWFTPGSSLEVDAITTVAYQGIGSLDGVFARARRHGKGVFVLAATSNPEAAATQRAVRADGLSVARGVLADLRARRPAGPADAVDALGVVLGGTVQLGDYGIEPEDLVGMPVLAPGFGHQGASFEDLRSIYGAAVSTVTVSASRSILSAGPRGIADAISRAQEEVVRACR